MFSTCNHWFQVPLPPVGGDGGGKARTAMPNLGKWIVSGGGKHIEQSYQGQPSHWTQLTLGVPLNGGPKGRPSTLDMEHLLTSVRGAVLDVGRGDHERYNCTWGSR